MKEVKMSDIQQRDMPNITLMPVSILDFISRFSVANKTIHRVSEDEIKTPLNIKPNYWHKVNEDPTYISRNLPYQRRHNGGIFIIGIPGMSDDNSAGCRVMSANVTVRHS